MTRAMKIVPPAVQAAASDARETIPTEGALARADLTQDRRRAGGA